MSLTKTVVLADKDARVPWPGKPGSLLPAEPFGVSVVDPFFASLIADGTLIESKPAKTPKPNS
jgi:hypothetical protein